MRVHMHEEDEARKVLPSLSLFSRATAKDARLTRLAGLTNRVFKVEVGGECFALRIPGLGTAEIIDRAVEEKNARAAAAAGVAPEVLYFAPDGVMLTRFIDAKPLSAEAFRRNPDSIDRTAHTLQRLHYAAEEFARTFDVFAIAADYVALLERRAFTLSPCHRQIVEDAIAIREPLATRPVPLRPCHCDPTGANLLDSGERVFMVDWEYSGMNDPAWDLAYLSVEGEFSIEQDAALLAAYLGHEATPTEAARVVVFKALCQLLSALWALVQHSAGSKVADFQGYAVRTFDRLAARTQSPAFSRALRDLRED